MNTQWVQDVWRKGLLVLVNLTLLAGLMWSAIPAIPASAASTGYVQDVAAGGWHTCALTSAGGVKCWGNDDNGQLGNGGANTDSLVPADVTGLASGVSAIALGRYHTCALTIAGGVKCWGDNQYGQLGDGSTILGVDSPIPVDVVGLDSGVSAIAAGEYHTCAVMDTTGEVKCWGSNSNGQLGNDSTGDSSTPVDVCANSGCPALLSGVNAVAAGFYHTCAMTTDGDAVCWGYNGDGQLGNGGSPVQSGVPVSVTLGSGSVVSHITAGAYHTCAVVDGGAMCWGDDQAGQLGDDAALADQSTPVSVAGLSADVSTIDGGYLHTCAVTSGGAMCWGDNESGQLGDGNTPTDSHTPTNVSGLSSNVNTVSAGVYHACALLSDGLVNCWGLNGDGQLSNGTNVQSDIPIDQLWETTYVNPTVTMGMCGADGPCYTSLVTALGFTVGNVTINGTVNVQNGTYAESLALDKIATVSFADGVTLDGDLAQSAGTIDAPSGTFSITGDLSRTGGSFNHNSGTIVFSGNGTQTLTGYTIFNDLTTNYGSILSLADEPPILGTFTNNGGVQQTKDVNGTQVGLLNLTNGSGTQKYWGVYINPGSSNMGQTTVTIRGNQDCTTDPTDTTVRRCFEISPETPAAATIIFYYSEAERNEQNNSTMQVYHWNAAAVPAQWELESGTYQRGGSGDEQYVEVTGVSNYSKFALSSSLTPPNAVELSAFAAMGSKWMYSLLISLGLALALARRRR